MNTIFKGFRLAAICCLGVMPVNVAVAADAGSQVVDEIVVTARKKSENIQDTPIAISAFNSAELQAANFQNIIDVSRATPGLFLETLNGVNARVSLTPRFRGVTFESDSTLQRTGSIFIDGILVSGGIHSIGVEQLERVEIIKGPQSALFGRNTFSGAINYVTKKPDEEFGADFSATLLSRGTERVSGSVEGALTDNIRGRLTGSFSSRDGHYDNENVDGQDLGNQESLSVGGTLVFDFSDNFTVSIRGDYYEDDDGPPAIILSAGFTEHNFGGFTLPDGSTTETAYRGTVRVPSGSEVGLDTSRETFNRITRAALNDPRGATFLGLDFDDLDANNPGLVREGERFALDAKYEFDNGIALQFLAGVNEDEYLVFSDFDSSPGNGSSFGFNTTGGRKTEDKSYELRLSGSAFDDRLDWTFGGNVIDIELLDTGGFFDGVLGFWFPGVFEDPTVTGAETTGIFGSIDYQFTDRLKLIAEARYQEDEISNDSANAGLDVPISPATFYAFLPRVVLQYELPSDAMVYFNYSLGNLPGGFNPEVGELDASQLAEFQALVPGVTTTFTEEELENFEFGLKQTTLDGSLAYNIAVFYMERTDQIFSGFEIVSDPTEINGVRTVAFTGNGATSDIYGTEIDVTWKATENLEIRGSLAYIDAAIDSFPAGANSGDFTAVFGPDADVSGQVAPRYPEWEGSLTAIYERNTTWLGANDWYLRGDLYYTGEFYDENTNLAKIPDALDLNLRAGLRFDRYTVELFALNVLDEDAPVAGNNIADTSLAVRFGSGFFDFSRESVHVALRDKFQVGLRVNVSL